MLLCLQTSCCIGNFECLITQAVLVSLRDETHACLQTSVQSSGTADSTVHHILPPPQMTSSGARSETQLSSELASGADESTICLPNNEVNALAFVKTPNEFDKYDKSTMKGRGCEKVVDWMYTKGLKLIEQHGNRFWKRLVNISDQTRSALGKQFTRVMDIWDMVDKRAQSDLGRAGATSEMIKVARKRAASVMDSERCNKKMRLNNWLEFEICAHTTISTALAYKDELAMKVSSARGVSSQVHHQVVSALKSLDHIISQAQARTTVVHDSKKKLHASVSLQNTVEELHDIFNLQVSMHASLFTNIMLYW